jgi:hypothetical protein
MKVTVRISIREALERLMSEEEINPGTYRDAILEEIENIEITNRNLKNEVEGLQQIASDCDFYHRFFLPLQLKSFHNIREAVEAFCKKEGRYLEQDTLVWDEGNLFWRAAFQARYPAENNLNYLKWYSVMGSILEGNGNLGNYIITRYAIGNDFEEREEDGSVRSEDSAASSQE